MKIEDELEKNGKVVIPGKGCSMKPLIRPGTDLMIIEKTDRFKLYDAVLYSKHRGRYVMHRIIGIDGEDYLIAGDNNERVSRVKQECILGKLTGIIRNEKTIYTDSSFYRTYSFVQAKLLPVRKKRAELMKQLSNLKKRCRKTD